MMEAGIPPPLQATLQPAPQTICQVQHSASYVTPASRHASQQLANTQATTPQNDSEGRPQPPLAPAHSTTPDSSNCHTSAPPSKARTQHIPVQECCSGGGGGFNSKGTHLSRDYAQQLVCVCTTHSRDTFTCLFHTRHLTVLCESANLIQKEAGAITVATIEAAQKTGTKAVTTALTAPAWGSW